MHCGMQLPKAAPAPLHNTQNPPAPTSRASPSNRGVAAIPIATAFEIQQRKMRRIGIVSGLLALSLVIALGLQASGFLSIFGNDASRRALVKKDKISTPSLEKLGNVAPPSIQKTATRIVMPQDIKDWLEHLHQTEIARVNLTNGQIAQARVTQAQDNITGGLAGVESALNGVDDPNSQLKSPVDGLAQMIKQMHDGSADLQAKFDAYPAPSECVPIQAAYDQALGETTAMLGDLGDHLAAGDVAKLQSMQGESAAGIDSAGAATDRLVGEICEKYDTKKWFTINKDIGPGGALAVPGF
jgi:hypothetical protein